MKLVVCLLGFFLVKMSFSLFLSHGLDSLSGKIATMETSISKITPFLGHELCFFLEASQSGLPHEIDHIRAELEK